jgi:hypothetical protein
MRQFASDVDLRKTTLADFLVQDIISVKVSLQALPFTLLPFTEPYTILGLLQTSLVYIFWCLGLTGVCREHRILATHS